MSVCKYIYIDMHIHVYLYTTLLTLSGFDLPLFCSFL